VVCPVIPTNLPTAPNVVPFVNWFINVLEDTETPETIRVAVDPVGPKRSDPLGPCGPVDPVMP
jgi:hypothetical protein